jgi:hypothetical protein
VYFRIAPSFKQEELTNVRVVVRYFDSTVGSFDIQYDGHETAQADRREKGGVLDLVVYPHGEHTPSRENAILRKSLNWENAEFQLRDVRFQNSQQGNADFRLRFDMYELFLHSVSMHVE